MAHEPGQHGAGALSVEEYSRPAPSKDWRHAIARGGSTGSRNFPDAEFATSIDFGDGRAEGLPVGGESR
jgi:hypothetical protein